MSHIEQGHSVLVSAPTGAGKTVIAEYVIHRCIERGEKVIYTSPIKALSNQKYREFQNITGSHAGILTGDITLDSEAPVLIMTTEIFRNKILESERSLHKYKWIIFDEIHYLDDYERGTVWEESLIFLPDHMNVLGLSATVPNINEIKAWLESIHRRKIMIVKEDKRPVPLHMFFQCQGKIYDSFHDLANYGYRIPYVRRSMHDKVPRHIQVKPNKPYDLIKHLETNDMLPCIYFVFSRRRTEELAEELTMFDFLDDEERKEILNLFDELCKRFDLTGEPGVEKIKPLVRRGIAYHHAGMLPTLKEVVERLFTSRLLKVIFTTETFALGINMPARSVIFDELRKFYGKGFDVLRTRDFYQMAGRAGRRSLDIEGFVFCRINPHDITANEVYRIIHKEPEKVRSQFNASYATILNLYQHYGEKLYDIYPSSFHFFQTSKINRRRAVYLMEAKVNILKELGHIKDEKLTPKGVFASRIYGYELILSELFEQGELEELSSVQLGILAAAAVYEPRKGQTRPKLSRHARHLEELTQEIARRIHRLEKIVGLMERTKPCHFHLAPFIEEWIKGSSFDDAMQKSDADEGEVVRYIRMSTQVLRQIMEGDVPDHLAQRINDTIRRINRDVIDSEKQLRS